MTIYYTLRKSYKKGRELVLSFEGNCTLMCLGIGDFFIFFLFMTDEVSMNHNNHSPTTLIKNVYITRLETTTTTRLILVHKYAIDSIVIIYFPSSAWPGEYHGFVNPDNLQSSLEAEIYFYSQVFGFTLADVSPQV